MRIGVVGLGAMGRAIATNLVQVGLQTVVWNRSPQPVDSLVAAGATRADEVAAAFRCDLVLSLLFDDAAVRQVMLDGGTLASASRDTIHVCMSTISTGLSRELAEAHEVHGSGYVAAPVFGRPEAAAAAKLEIVTAGADDLLDRIEPLLRILGRTWRMGERPELAHLAKIAGNFMISTAVETMAEGAALLSARGADPAPFLSMMAETLLSAPVYRSYGPAVASSRYDAGAPSGLRLPLAGVGRTLDEARAAGLRLPLAELMQARLHEAERRGYAGDEWSVAISKVARADRLGP